MTYDITKMSKANIKNKVAGCGSAFPIRSIPDIDEEVEVVKVDEYGQQYVALEMQTVTKVLKNQPTAVVCRNEDVYLDPTCMDDMDKCQFVIHRYETDLSTLKADGRYKNLDKVAQMSTRDDTTFIPKDETRFNFEDQARKKMVVYEYWGNYDAVS